MKQNLKQNLVTGGGKAATVLADYALEFNGTDEYLQIALPADLAVFTPSTISAGSAPTGWTKYGSPTITYETTESGSSGCMKMIATTVGLTKDSILTVGKKYKISVRYKSTTNVRFGYTGPTPSTTAYGFFTSTSEWCTVTRIITAGYTGVSIINDTSGTTFIESITIKEDQGFDLNKDQEQILHSKNWDFERTLETELASGTVTIGSKYVVTAGTVEGNAVGTEFLAVTNATTLDASNKVKPIPNLVSNGTFEDTSSWSGINTNNWDYDAIGKKLTITNAPSATLTQVGFQGVAGKRYRITMEISDYTAGDLTFELGSGGNQAAFSAPIGDGVKTVDYTPNQSGYFRFIAWQNFRGSIDNIHIYEIPEWTASGNHTSDISTLDKSGTGATNTQSLKVTASGAGDTSNCVTLPSANLESCVATKKYTIQGEARLDASSLPVGSELFTAFTNSTANPYETLTASGNSITSAINTTANGSVYVNNIITGNSGDSFLVSFNFTLNSGISPNVLIMLDGDAITGSSSNIFNPVNGFNNVLLTLTGNVTNGDLAIWRQFACNFSLTDFTVKKLTASIPVLTAQLGTKSVTSSALSIVAGTFTKFVLNFEATASEVSQDLKLWLNGAGSVFVDKLSLTQAYDMWIIQKVKVSNAGSFELFRKATALGTPYIGMGIWGNSTNYYFNLNSESTTAGIESPRAKSTGTLPNDTWLNVALKVDRTTNVQYGNVNNLATNSITYIGKIITNNNALIIGGVTSYYLNGQISHIQIIRFENISQSSFNSAITGLQYPAGGGAEEVLRLTFQSGYNIAECLKDYSPKAHTVSGVNVDITNRKRVTA